MTLKVVQSPILYPETKEFKNREIRVLDTFKNLEWLLSHFKAEIKYNQMSRKREIIIPEHYVFSDDEQNDCLARVENIAILNDMPDKHIDKHLRVLAGENPYHPIVECIKNNPWDGINRLDDFINTIQSTRPEIDKIIIKTWMVAAIAAAHSKTGFTNHGVLVLQGEQGIGKTEWVKSLDPINCQAVKVGVLLEPKNKDSVIGANRFWIVELGELDATFNKTDIAHLKSYITSPVDDVRVPFGICETRMVRRTAYVATVNEKCFLIDTTGNRRWWTVSVTSINYEHGMDMKQIWAEVYQYWKEGFLTYLPQDIQFSVNQSNKEHEKIDPLKEKVLQFYNWSNEKRQASATTVLEELGYKNPTRAEATRMGTILKEINGKEGKRTVKATLHEVPYCPYRNFM